MPKCINTISSMRMVEEAAARYTLECPFIQRPSAIRMRLSEETEVLLMLVEGHRD